MNKHIELVRKCIADPTSVTQEELEANLRSAHAATAAAAAACRAADAAVTAAFVVAPGLAAIAKDNVKQYDEFMEEKNHEPAR